MSAAMSTTRPPVRRADEADLSNLHGTHSHGTHSHGTHSHGTHLKGMS